MTNESAKEALLHVVRRDPHQFDQPTSRWTLDALRGVCDWLDLHTTGSMSALLKRLGIRLKRGREHVHSPDKDYLAKLRDVHVCIERSSADPELLIVLFQDEMTYFRRPSVSFAYEARGRRQAYAELGHRTNQRARIAAAVDVWTGRVIYRQARQMGVTDLVAFYQQIHQAYPDAENIYLVQDNWAVHDHPDVRAALTSQQFDWPIHVPKNWRSEPKARAQRLNLPIQLVKLPTYASWTNPIEKLWRKLRQELLHMHPFGDDWTGLKQAVAKFLDQFAVGSPELLRYIGLRNPHRLYYAVLANAGPAPP